MTTEIFREALEIQLKFLLHVGTPQHKFPEIILKFVGKFRGSPLSAHLKVSQAYFRKFFQKLCWKLHSKANLFSRSLFRNSQLFLSFHGNPSTKYPTEVPSRFFFSRSYFVYSFEVPKRVPSVNSLVIVSKSLSRINSVVFLKNVLADRLAL